MDSLLDWPTRMKNIQRTGCVTTESLTPPLRLAWQFKLGYYVWDSAVIIKDRVFIPGDQGLYLISLNDGTLIKKNDQIIAASNYTSATVWQDMAFICGKECLYIVNAQTGEINTTIKPGSISSSPCVYQDTVYWCTKEGFLYAADIYNGSIKWKYDTQGEYTQFTPSALNNTIYFVGSKYVYALEAAAGALRWRRQIEGSDNLIARDTATIYKDNLLIAIERLGLFSLDVTTGEVRWQYKTQFGPFTAPCVAELNGIVYVASRQLYAVEIETGQEIWTSKHQGGLTTSAPIIVGDHIYIGGGDWRFIYAFDRRTGEKVWQYPTGDLVYSTPAYAYGRLVIGSHDGYVYCFEESK